MTGAFVEKRMAERVGVPGLRCPVEVGPASSADVDRLLGLERESFSVPWTRKMFEAELTGNPFAHVLAARTAGERQEAERAHEIVGFVCFWVVFDELRVMDLAVDPRVRRQGVAARLVGCALASGLAGGAKRALLEVRSSNSAARRLYERFGFREVGVRARYYTNPVEDAVLMELEPIPKQAEVQVEV
jgi:ribosomal-protein-alanine N-acetyltransferase